MEVNIAGCDEQTGKCTPTLIYNVREVREAWQHGVEIFQLEKCAAVFCNYYKI